MSLLVDTSVWSLALRRDSPVDIPEVRALRNALAGAATVATTGVVLQEVLQGVVPEATRTRIVETFSGLEYIAATRDDHVAAAELRNALRAKGVQVGTIDALIAQLAIAGDRVLLTTDKDLINVSKKSALRVWHP